MPGAIPRFRMAEVQEGGSGSNSWKPIAVYNDKDGVKLTAPDGGDIEFTDHYARNWMNGGQLEIINTFQTGQPQPYTFDLEVPLEIRRYLSELDGKKNLRIRFFTGDYTVPTNYGKMFYLINSRNTKMRGSFPVDFVNDTEDVGDQLRRTFPQRAIDIVDIDPVQHLKISGTVTTLQVNHVISVGYPRSAGDVSGENTNSTGDKEFIAVTSKNVSNLPLLFWTNDKGATWTSVTLTGLTNGDAFGVAKAGAYIVVAMQGAGGGLAYAKWDDIKAGTATWTRSTNISAGTVVNMVMAVSASTLYAVGNSGAVYKSTDSGITFTSLGTAVTANNLTKIAVADESLIWFGGASGTLVKCLNGVMSVVTVTGISTNAINSMAVPPGLTRGSELFIGAADGNVYVTVNSTATTPTWATRAFDSSGAGAVDGLAFAGPDGCVLWLAQTNGSSQSRILRDLSGGKLGLDVEIIGGFTSPANSTFNAIAAGAGNCNNLMVVGDINTSQGYLGSVAA